MYLSPFAELIDKPTQNTPLSTQLGLLRSCRLSRPSMRRLEQRGGLASGLQSTATKTIENSIQFAVCLLNQVEIVIKIN